MGIVLGALGGMGEEMTKIASSNRKAWQDEDKARLDSDLTLAREQTMLALRNDAELKQIPLKAKATADAAAENAPTMARAASTISTAAAQDELTNAPIKAQAKLANEYSPGIVSAAAGKAKAEAKARAEAETEALTARGNSPDAIKAIRNIANANHVEGLGSVMQAKLAQLGIEEKTKVNALISEFENTKDPERKAAIKESLTVRGIIKPGEFDTEKVSTETMNPDGSTTKTERTQKRRPDGTTPQAGKQDVRVAGQVIGQASTPEEAQKLVAQWKASKGGKPAPAAPKAEGGSSGSHTPAAPAKSQDREIRAQIMDKRQRLSLPGIGPEAKAQLMLDLRELEDRLNQKSAFTR